MRDAGVDVGHVGDGHANLTGQPDLTAPRRCLVQTEDLRSAHE
jgi:hypothetical protein